MLVVAVIFRAEMPSGLFGVDSDVIIGSNHGQSARPWVVDAALNYFSREGLRTRLNAPFSGGFITKNYGNPVSGVSALQTACCVQVSALLKELEALSKSCGDTGALREQFCSSAGTNATPHRNTPQCVEHACSVSTEM